MRLCLHDKVWRFERTMSLFARGAMAARQVLTLKIEVRVLAGEPLYSNWGRSNSRQEPPFPPVPKQLAWCTLTWFPNVARL